MTALAQYLAGARRLVDIVEALHASIAAAADQFARTILAGRMVHV